MDLTVFDEHKRVEVVGDFWVKGAERGCGLALERREHERRVRVAVDRPGDEPVAQPAHPIEQEEPRGQRSGGR